MKKSIGQRAVDFAGDRSQGAGHGFPSWEASLIKKGYEKGAKDQKKLMYSEKEVNSMLTEILKERYQSVPGIYIVSTNHIQNVFNQFKKS